MDEALWNVLIALRKTEGLKYSELKSQIPEVSDSVFLFRLGLLRAYHLVKVKPVVTETKNYFLYELTDAGKQFVDQLNLKDFMTKYSKFVDKISKAGTGRP